MDKGKTSRHFWAVKNCKFGLNLRLQSFLVTHWLESHWNQLSEILHMLMALYALLSPITACAPPHNSSVVLIGFVSMSSRVELFSPCSHTLCKHLISDSEAKGVESKPVQLFTKCRNFATFSRVCSLVHFQHFLRFSETVLKVVDL